MNIFQLQQPLTFNENVQAVSLPAAFNATPAGAEATLAGWGTPYVKHKLTNKFVSFFTLLIFFQTGGLFMKNLQKVNIQVYSDEDCESLHALTGPTDSYCNLCAGVDGGGKGQCSVSTNSHNLPLGDVTDCFCIQGDSGGPLVVNGTQVGIVSWSVKPCTVAPYPGVFTKVSTYVDWIQEHIS